MGDRLEVQVGEVLEVEPRVREGGWRKDRRGLRLGDRVEARSEVRSRHGWILVETETMVGISPPTCMSLSTYC